MRFATLGPILLFQAASLFAEPHDAGETRPQERSEYIGLRNPCCLCEKFFYEWEPNPRAVTNAPMTFTDLLGIPRFVAKYAPGSVSGVVRLGSGKQCESLNGNRTEYQESGETAYSAYYELGKCRQVAPMGGICRFSEDPDRDFEYELAGTKWFLIHPARQTGGPGLRKGLSEAARRTDPILNTVAGKRGHVTHINEKGERFTWPQ